MRSVAWGLLILCLATGVGQACTCVPGMSNATQYSGASDVFVGTVLSVGHWRTKYRIRIERSWKGVPAGKTVAVYTSGNGAMCGVDLPVGHEVILFAHRVNNGPAKGQLSAGLCGQPYGFSVSTVNDSLGPPLSVRSKGSWWPW